MRSAQHQQTASPATSPMSLARCSEGPRNVLEQPCSMLAGRQPILTFEPSSGTVPARGQLALAVTFAPTSTAASNYNVVCLVKKKPSKLTLNVKGEGYAVHDSLHTESADGHLVELSPDAPNHLDFGQVCCLPSSFVPQAWIVLFSRHVSLRRPYACSEGLVF